MTLWEYLKSKMERYGERIAFANSGLTYRELVSFPNRAHNESRLLICEGKSREEQAISILRCIAEGNVAVPITKEYGIKKLRVHSSCRENRYCIRNNKRLGVFDVYERNDRSSQRGYVDA